MTFSTSLALLSNKHEGVLFFQEGLWHARISTASGETGVLDEMECLCAAGRVGRSSLEELHIVLHLKRHSVVQDILEEIDESSS